MATTTVSQSRTLIPPFVPDPRDVNPIFDDTGRPVIGGNTQAILDAINELSRKFDKMSGSITQVETDIATITTANAKMTADLDAIKALIAGMTTGTVLTQADIDALHAAAGVSASNTAEADAMVPTPAAPTPTP